MKRQKVIITTSILVDYPAKSKKIFLKSDHEQRKATKFNSILDELDKKLLRSIPGNYKIDSLIVKKTDKKHF